MDDEQVELAGGGVDTIAQEFNTYEDYLDRQVTSTDLFYLEDVELARQLVELGYRGNGEILRRDEFEARKEAAELSRQQKLRNKPKKLASAGKDCEGKPLLYALQQREVRQSVSRLTWRLHKKKRKEKKNKKQTLTLPPSPPQNLTNCRRVKLCRRLCVQVS